MSVSQSHFELDIASSIVSSALDTDSSYVISSAAYVQAMDGETPDQIVFDTKRSETDPDAYVFCLFTGLLADDDRSDKNLWRFFVLPTDSVDKFSDGFITLPVLLDLGRLCSCSDLPDVFKAVIHQ